MAEKIINVDGVNTPKTNLGKQKMEIIVSAAVDLFTKEGFYQTSISDICKKAKTAVGTFYIYFDSKADIYRYLMEKYKIEIKRNLSTHIKGCSTRFEREREGIKCFLKYVLLTPNVYEIIWGSLSIDHNLFSDYYESFAKSYAYSLCRDSKEVATTDYKTLAYMLMGISNFLGLKTRFENMNEQQIDEMIEQTVMPLLSNGIFAK